MRQAPDGRADEKEAPSGPPHDQPVVRQAAALLARPGLVIITGGPGCGRSTVLRQIGEGYRGPIFAGGGLAMLRSTPAFALTRAVRVRLPTHDSALLAEAVRSRVRGGLLLIDDLQWADPATLAALIPLATHCRVVVALRTPHRLPDATVAALRNTAAGWLTVPPLGTAAATILARTVAPGLSPAAVSDVVRRGGGVPLAIEALARHSAARAATTEDEVDQVGYAVAAALSDLTRPARTTLAALGLLGRPADAALLGPGVDELAAAGLVTTGSDRQVDTVSPYVAEVAAGLLDDDARRALHRRLADLVPPREAARHFAAAGDHPAAYQRALAAADESTTTGERAELLMFACQLAGIDPEPATRIAAATAALACGQPRAAARVLTTTAPLGVTADILRAEALLLAGEVHQARAVAAPIPDSAPGDLVAARDRILLLAQLAEDPTAAAATAARLAVRHGATPIHPGLRAALAAVAAANRTAGWEEALTTAAGAASEPLAARWSAWLLVDTLAADGRLAEAAQAAAAAAQACADDLAYSWQTRFLAAQLWCTALRGSTGCDEVLRQAGDLTDRTLPALARNYAVAAASLVEADGGLLGPARARLAAESGGSAGTTALLDWVSREAAWLDGQPEQAAAPAGAGAPPLVDGLRRITAWWAAHDGAAHIVVDDDPPSLPPVRETLTAWAVASEKPEAFGQAAAGWQETAVREQVRCLIAQGVHEEDPTRAVPPLLAAEELAEQAGLVVLLGRTRRALRRHSIARGSRGARAGDDLTVREREVLRLVAAGEPTRRIAGQLGISAETVETHIRAGMRKLGARTRTEAAVLALEVLE
ncbi:MAG TPA: LuxR C-terminal-related transcriptional regulator [Micromonosporaceae bacterium]|nr:LuxR C-terminal-related transcriptional regulator [Micromonosporaceae bacterium]